MEDLGNRVKSPERDFKNLVIAALTRKGWQCMKIETGSTRIGVADVYAIHTKLQMVVWMEFKSTPKLLSRGFVQGTRLLPLRPGQEKFLRDNTLAGVPSCVIMECSDMYLVIPSSCIEDRRVVCGGRDAMWVQKSLTIKEDMDEIAAQLLFML